MINKPSWAKVGNFFLSSEMKNSKIYFRLKTILHNEIHFDILDQRTGEVFGSVSHFNPSETFWNRDVYTLIAEPSFEAEEEAEVKPTSVCSVCNDTHRHRMIGFGSMLMPCTHCPVPCAKCCMSVQTWQGAYCKNTPCDCECHQEKK